MKHVLLATLQVELYFFYPTSIKNVALLVAVPVATTFSLLELSQQITFLQTWLRIADLRTDSL